MSNKLVNDAMTLNESGSVQIDESPAAWAKRAFAMVATLGSIEGALSDETTGAFSELLAKAPDEVLIGGVTMILQAQAIAAILGDVE